MRALILGNVVVTALLVVAVLILIAGIENTNNCLEFIARQIDFPPLTLFP